MNHEEKLVKAVNGLTAAFNAGNGADCWQSITDCCQCMTDAAKTPPPKAATPAGKADVLAAISACETAVAAAAAKPPVVKGLFDSAFWMKLFAFAPTFLDFIRDLLKPETA